MQRIGPYQVMGEIGRGGMGVVLRGLDPTIGRQVAIKVILLQEFSDLHEREMLRARLFREAQAAGVLNHPSIVTVYYVGEEGETAFIAMEYVGGATLEKALTTEPRPSRELLCRVLRQVASALDYAHGKGVIHRDIKPANIMLDEQGNVKICDFGIAKGGSGQASLTKTGTSLGSPFYMSPEQIRGDPVDGRTDQYSLGVVAYQILTGQRPFHADTIQTLFFRIMSSPPSPAHEMNPALGPEVNTVLQKALAKEPAARYASCGEFVETLVEKLAGNGSPAPVEGRRSRLWVPAMVAVLLGLAGVVGYVMWPKHAAPEQHATRKEIIQKAPDLLRQTPTQPPPQTPAVLPATVVERFKVDPATIAAGESATLSWSVKNAVEVRIEPGVGVVKATGTRSVTPEAGTTTYKLFAKGPKASPRPATVSLTVEQPKAPVIEDFFASPASIQSGQPAMLHWSVRNATEISIAGLGPMQQTSRPVFPTESRTYVLLAKGAGGSVARSVAVSVTIPAGKAPEIVSFSVDPETIGAGEATVLRWQVKNATSVQIDHGVGGVEASGVLQVFPEAATTYKIFATNNRGTFNRTAKIKITK